MERTRENVRMQMNRHSSDRDRPTQVISCKSNLSYWEQGRRREGSYTTEYSRRGLNFDYVSAMCPMYPMQLRNFNLNLMEGHEHCKAAQMVAGAYSVVSIGLHDTAATSRPCPAILGGIPVHTGVVTFTVL